MKEKTKEHLEGAMHSIIAHATIGIEEVNLPVIQMIIEQTLKQFDKVPNGLWRKTASELPKQFEPVLLKFPTGARRIGQYCESLGFHPYGYRQDWTMQPVEWQPLAE